MEFFYENKSLEPTEFYLFIVSLLYESYSTTCHTRLQEETYLNVVSDCCYGSGDDMMFSCPNLTSGVLGQSAHWELGVIVSPWSFNSKIISFHHQMHRRSKPDQIEERRSVGSVWAGKWTHGSTMTDWGRVEMRFDCLFLQVQVCLLVILAIFTST